MLYEVITVVRFQLVVALVAVFDLDDIAGEQPLGGTIRRPEGV